MSEIFAQIEAAAKFSTKKIWNWQRYLFTNWEMTPIQEEYIVNMCERNELFARAIQNDVTLRLMNYIDYRVRKCSGDPKQNSNLNIILLGEQDSGKSTYAVKIFLYYAKKHKELWDRDAKHKWTFKSPETLEAYSNVENFTMILQDENDELQGEGARTTYKQLGNLVNRARFTGISLVISCPVVTQINGCDYALQPFGFGKKGAKLYRETGDFSKTEGRAILYCKSRLKSEGYIPLGYVRMEMASAIKFMENNNYYTLKRKSFDDLREGEGASGIDRKKKSKKLEKYAQILLEIAIENGWDGTSKKELNTWLDNTNIPTLTTTDMPKLFNRTYRLYKKQFKSEAEVKKIITKKQFDTSNEFQVNILEILETLEKMDFKNWKTKERDIAIYKEMYEKPQLTNEQLTDNEGLKSRFSDTYPNDQSVFTKIRSKMAGHISNIFGTDFELYRKAKYEKDPEIKKVVHNGEWGKPDLILHYKNNKIATVSIKCFGFKGRSKSVKITEFAPEIIEAQKLLKKKKVVECWADIYNFYTKKLYKYSFSPEEIQSFTRKSNKRILIKP